MEGSGCGRCPAHCLLSSDDACRGGMKSCLQREETSPIGLKYDVPWGSGFLQPKQEASIPHSYRFHNYLGGTQNPWDHASSDPWDHCQLPAEVRHGGAICDGDDAAPLPSNAVDQLGLGQVASIRLGVHVMWALIMSWTILGSQMVRKKRKDVDWAAHHSPCHAAPNYARQVYVKAFQLDTPEATKRKESMGERAESWHANLKTVRYLFLFLFGCWLATPDILGPRAGLLDLWNMTLLVADGSLHRLASCAALAAAGGTTHEVQAAVSVLHLASAWRYHSCPGWQCVDPFQCLVCKKEVNIITF